MNNVVSLKDYNVIPNSQAEASNNQKKINTAIVNLNAKGGGVLVVPEGTYFVSIPNRSEAIIIMHNITLRGESKQKSVIQFLGRNSRYWAAIVMRNNSRLENLTLKDDKTNNQQPSTTGTTHQDNPQALIEIAGLHSTVDGCDLYNSSTWCIYSDDSAKNPKSRRDDVTIRNCRNYWEKRSYYSTPFDISQFYIKVDVMTLEKNEFYTDEPLLSRTVFDVNGTVITIQNNKVYNYVQAVLIGSSDWVNDKPALEKNIIIRDNIFEKIKTGIMMHPDLNVSLENILINNNKIILDINKNNNVWDSAATLTAGITVYPGSHGKINNLRIEGNHIEWISKPVILTEMGLIGGISFFNGIAGGFDLEDCTISNNTIKNFPSMGISIGSNTVAVGVYNTKNVKILNNTLVDNGIHKDMKNGKNPIDMKYTNYYFTHIFVMPLNLSNIEIAKNTFVDTGKNNLNGVYWLTLMNDIPLYTVKRLLIQDNILKSFSKELASNIWNKINSEIVLKNTESIIGVPSIDPLEYEMVFKNFEVRTDDPTSPPVGKVWLRSDLEDTKYPLRLMTSKGIRGIEYKIL